MEQIEITPIPALNDNYIWIVISIAQHTALVIDPGDATPVIDFLTKHQLSLQAILITHHHWDHVNGISELLHHFDIPIYASAKEKLPSTTMPLYDDNEVRISTFPIVFHVLAIPGHTSGHIAYYSPGMLFCGDTLFAAGCGKLFEGTAAQMYASLQKIAALPFDTKIYCAHEYTLNNLRFAQTVEPHNSKILERIQRVTTLRNKKLPSLPSTLQEELETNPFLRCKSPELKANVEAYAHQHLQDPMEIFSWLRKWKDNF